MIYSLYLPDCVAISFFVLLSDEVIFVSFFALCLDFLIKIMYSAGVLFVVCENHAHRCVLSFH